MAFAQAAQNEREPAITRSRPLHGDACDVKWQIKTYDQRTSADGLPEHLLDKIGSRHNRQVCVCAASKLIREMPVAVCANCLSVFSREIIAIENAFLDGH